MPVSFILEIAVREWLKKRAIEAVRDEAQRELHAAAEKHFGVLSGHVGSRAETVRETVRRRVRERISRSRKKADSSLRSE
jgi:hypothetical protein